MKYKCIVFDHDDTVVMSTPAVNFVSFLETLSQIRPGMELSLDEFLLGCCDPGFDEYCRCTLGFTDEEMALQLSNWMEYVKTHIAPPFEGMDHLIKRLRENGIKICVATHSVSTMIEDNYAHNFGFQPDLIYGWDCGEDKRKPSPFPVLDTMEKYGITPDEVLVVDDLKPGYDMAKAAGVKFCWAGWTTAPKQVADFMRELADFAPSTVEELERHIFEE